MRTAPDASLPVLLFLLLCASVALTTVSSDRSGALLQLRPVPSFSFGDTRKANSGLLPMQDHRVLDVMFGRWKPFRQNLYRRRRTVPAKVDLKGMQMHELEEWLAEVIREDRNSSSAARRARQIWSFMHGERNFVRRWEDASKSLHPNGFSTKFIENISKLGATVHGGLLLDRVEQSQDGTRKFLFSIHGDEDSAYRVETVAIPMERTVTSGDRKRITICVSSQVGCAMGCSFCYTGQMGFQRNLTASQIVEQVLSVRRELPISEGHPQATNIVFMGMGEPFHNLGNVIQAIRIFTTEHPNTRHFSPGKITVSTVGMIPEIKRFYRETQAKLAVSLHATTDELRSQLMPINKRYNLSSLMGVLGNLYPRDAKHSVLIEYLLLAGINDSDEDAVRLLALTDKINCVINLIEFNPNEGSPFRKSSRDRTESFQRIIESAGRPVSLRRSRGDENMAACGQLGLPNTTIVRARR